MDALIPFLGFIYVILILATILFAFFSICMFVFLASNSEKVSRYASLVLLITICLGISAYLIDNYKSSLETSHRFEQYLNSKQKQKVRWIFGGLSNKEKEKYIEIIFHKFYDKGLKGKINFINDYGDENIPFVHNKRKDIGKDIEYMYNIAENENTSQYWLMFSSKIRGDIFLKYADECLQEREFNKWKDDDSAWERVLVMDSVRMSREYLSRYNHGSHENHARKIILDCHYKKIRPPHKIKSNYSGETRLSIRNMSNNIPIKIEYKGTFEKGEYNLPTGGFKTLYLPNGYYTIRASAPERPGTTSKSSVETLDGEALELEYYITSKISRY